MSDQFAGAVDLSDRVVKSPATVNPMRETKTVIQLTREEERVAVPVIDKFPQMGDVHVEGRRIVELSIEMFMDMMKDLGWTPVLPEQKENQH